MHQTNRLKKGLALLLTAALLLTGLPAVTGAAEPASPLPIIDVDAYTARAEISPYTLGSNHRHAYGGFGMYDEEMDEVYPEFLQMTKEAGLGVVRYPGGTIANLFTWKDTIGPREERRNVVLGNSYASVFPYYGLDEHMAYTEEIGAEVIYMVGEAAETPQGAADLVEYLNAENDGSNPGGGVDWAAVRAKNGHPEPYDVPYFEIGNEMYIDNQQYWLDLPSVSGNTDRASRYMRGDTVAATDAPARVYGTWTDNTSTGEAGQSFYTQYNPVVEGTEAVYVGGEKWTRVDSLEASGGAERVYTFDYTTGGITFGDGAHGRIPETGAKITVDYHHRHAGFTEYYDAMKAIDPDIQIFATLPYAFNFVEGTKCDGIVYHDYTGYPATVADADELHDHYMTISDNLVQMIDNNVSQLRERSKRQDTVAAVTEFGTINNPHIYSEDPSNEGREEARSLSRALSFAVTFMGSSRAESLIHIQQAFTAYSFGGGPGLPNADYVYNSMYAPYPDDPTRFIEGGTALAYKVIGNNIGDTVRNTYVQNNPIVGEATQYEALRVMASQTDENGDLYLLVVNRDDEQDITAGLNLKGYTISGNARIQTLNAPDIASTNTPDHPDEIAITEAEVPLGIGQSSFSYTFPAHSLVAIRLTGRSAAPYTDSLPLQTFDEVEECALPDGMTAAGTASVAAVDGGENKALLLERGNANTTVTAPLTADSTGCDGILRLSFDLRAEQSSAARLQMSLMSGEKEALLLAFEGGFVKNDGKIRAVYTPGQFHHIEISADCRAGQYTVYFDGSYMGTLGKYSTGAAATLDAIRFEAMTRAGSFYVDNYKVEAMSAELVSAVTQADDLFVSTTVGKAPVLPETVTVRCNTGEVQTRAVTWDAVEAEAYSAVGQFAVAGSIEGLTVRARALVTVSKAVEKIEIPALSTLAGVAPRLPKTLTVLYTDGSTAAEAVTWEPVDKSQYAAAGSFTVKGNLPALGRTVEAAVSVIARANAPLVVVDGYTSRSESGPVAGSSSLDVFIENNPPLSGGTDRLLQAAAAADAAGNLYLYLINRSKAEAATASVLLKGYTITGRTAVRIAAYDESTALEPWTDDGEDASTAALGVGGSSFSCTVPAGSVAALKIRGERGENTPWSDNFWVRHFGAAAVGAVPSYFSKESGTASVQKEPGNPAEQVFMLKREGEDVRVKSTLSGTDFPAASPKNYDGLVKISFRLKAMQTSGCFRAALMAGDRRAVELCFSDGAIRCGDREVGRYRAETWYSIELVLDHRAGSCSLYSDGVRLVSQAAYADVSAPLDFVYFSAEEKDSTFYLDDYQVRTVGTNLAAQLTQIEKIRLTMPVGMVPELPTAVTAGYNTGERLSLSVVWEAVDPAACAAPGSFTLLGKVAETDLPAEAEITVYDPAVLPGVLPGDLDDDGKVTVSDVVRLRQLIVSGAYSDREFAAGNLDSSDNLLTVSDVVELRKRIVRGA